MAKPCIMHLKMKFMFILGTDKKSIMVILNANDEDQELK